MTSYGGHVSLVPEQHIMLLLKQEMAIQERCRDGEADPGEIRASQDNYKTNAV